MLLTEIEKTARPDVDHERRAERIRAVRPVAGGEGRPAGARSRRKFRGRILEIQGPVIHTDSGPDTGAIRRQDAESMDRPVFRLVLEVHGDPGSLKPGDGVSIERGEPGPGESLLAQSARPETPAGEDYVVHLHTRNSIPDAG